MPAERSTRPPARRWKVLQVVPWPPILHGPSKASRKIDHMSRTGAGPRPSPLHALGLCVDTAAIALGVVGSPGPLLWSTIGYCLFAPHVSRDVLASTREPGSGATAFRRSNLLGGRPLRVGMLSSPGAEAVMGGAPARPESSTGRFESSAVAHGERPRRTGLGSPRHSAGKRE